ncbi:MAG: T9SS type A sorting domain-containing protein [Flavobacteriales bacterium]|nr:T9SS type A sorting domain-containing protein [Flavobacteriales bacterium]
MKKLLLALCLGIMTTSFGQNIPLYSMGPQSTDLEVIDTSTWTITSTIAITSDFGIVAGINGATIQPCSGEIYVNYKSGGNRRLGILDPATAAITDIGDMGDWIATLAFEGDVDVFSLIAITGENGSPSEQYFEVNTATAAITSEAAATGHSDGEALAYCSDNGHFYRWSGWSSPGHIMEKVNPTTYAATNIPLSGGAYENCGGAVYIGGGNFLCGDVNDEEFFVVDTNGVVDAFVPGISGNKKGLVFPLRWIESDVSDICGDDVATITATEGDSYEWFQDGSSTGTTTPTFEATAPGDYYCVITMGPCSFPSNTITIGTGTAPVVTITPDGDLTLCDGETITLSGTTDASQQWYMNGSEISGETSGTYDVTDPGVYNILVTNADGCADSAAVAAVVVAAPEIALDPEATATYCEGDSVMISATSGWTDYNWYLDGTLMAGETGDAIYASAEGTYSCAATFDGCVDSTATGTVVTEEDCDLGFDESAIFNLEVYPNPTKGIITIQLTENTSALEIEILAVDGTVVYQSQKNVEGPFNFEVDLSDFESGTYLLRLKNAEQMAIHKITKF